MSSVNIFPAIQTYEFPLNSLNNRVSRNACRIIRSDYMHALINQTANYEIIEQCDSIQLQFICICIYICIHINMSIYIFFFIYLYLCLAFYAYVYIYIYIYWIQFSLVSSSWYKNVRKYIKLFARGFFQKKKRKKKIK